MHSCRDASFVFDLARNTVELRSVFGVRVKTLIPALEDKERFEGFVKSYSMEGICPPKENPSGNNVFVARLSREETIWRGN